MKCFQRLLIAAAITFTATQMTLQGVVPTTPGTGFRQDLQELLDSLTNAQLLPQLDADQEAEFLRNILEDLAIPAIITNLAKAATPEPAAMTPSLSNLSENDGILYVSLNNFQQADQQQAAVLSDNFKQQAGRALVIDLRHAQGFSTEAEEENLSFLQAISVPMLILMDSKTAGTPESMIRKLKNEREILTLGTPTLGIGGSGQEIKLSSGLTLRVPRIENDQLPGPLEPDVTLRENPAPIDPALDPWCRHARDTLKLILTLK